MRTMVTCVLMTVSSRIFRMIVRMLVLMQVLVRMDVGMLVGVRLTSMRVFVGVNVLVLMGMHMVMFVIALHNGAPFIS